MEKWVSAHPREVRAAIGRSEGPEGTPPPPGHFGMQPTSGCCDGYLQVRPPQPLSCCYFTRRTMFMLMYLVMMPATSLLPKANIVMIPEEYADQFEEFCRLNCRPCPLLFRSAPGQTDAGPLAADSDIRRQLPAYNVYRNGELSETVANIEHLDTSRFATFYMGCSFSFERCLTNAGVPVRNIEQGCNVSMYRTNRQCDPVPPFHGPMVVSMRPVPADMVDRATEATIESVLAHGAVIHAGNPLALGITDIDEPDFGDPVRFEPGDVPCFWACGVTCSMAVVSARLPLVITHKPGCMFITDLKEDEVGEVVKMPGLAGFPARLQARINTLEALLWEDPMKRGIEYLKLPTQLWHSAVALQRAKRVLITTGFPCVMADPPTESDGPLGAVVLAVALARLGIHSTIVVEPINEKVVEAAFNQARCLAPEVAEQLELVITGELTDDAAEAMLNKLQVDVLVAIERAGLSKSRSYRTMRARKMHGVVNIEALFDAAEKKKLVTIGIGDGGNELGMGKVSHLVECAISLGFYIACTTSTQFLIAAGVSNWGALGLACATLLLDAHARSSTNELAPKLPTTDFERTVLRDMFDAGCRDGVKPEQEMSVDGMLYDNEHADFLTRVRQLCLKDWATA